MRICFVLTTAFAVNAFVAPTIRELIIQGWTITVVLNTESGKISDDIAPHIEVIDMDIVRTISPFTDLKILALPDIFIIQ